MATPNRAKAFIKKGLLALALAGAMLLAPLAFAGCQNGQDGKDGADGAAWLTGTESPTAAQGKNGDLYLDTDDYILYQKSGDQWKVLQEFTEHLKQKNGTQ